MLQRQRAFTLIELMIVVAIIGILAAIAIPSYQEYVRKSRRTDATVAMSKIQQAQEKWRANNSSYSVDITSTGLNVSTLSTATTATSESSTSTLGGDGYYTINISSNTATGYILTATSTGQQASDSNCKKLILTVNYGNATPTSKNSSGAASTNCWK
jgi:type IV pilus assembly protein PilE